MSRVLEDEAAVSLRPHLTAGLKPPLEKFLLARVESFRTRLEIEEDERVRGHLKELRELIKLLCE
jgi:hypothetical protein